MEDKPPPDNKTPPPSAGFKRPETFLLGGQTEERGVATGDADARLTLEELNVEEEKVTDSPDSASCP